MCEQRRNIVNVPALRQAEASAITLDRALFLLRSSGAAEGTRTPDPIITNDVLYQLSYSGLVAGLITPSKGAV